MNSDKFILPQVRLQTATGNPAFLLQKHLGAYMNLYSSLSKCVFADRWKAPILREK